MTTTRNGPIAALLVLLVLACGAMSGCGGGPDPNLDLGGIDMGEVLDGLLARTQRAIAGISGIDSAKRARAELELVNQDFDDLIYHLPSLGDDGRAELAKKSSRALADLGAVRDQIAEMPALDEILGPTLGETVARLEQVR